MSNNNNAKTSSNIKYIFMVAAIASVLALGTGYSSMQSFGTLGASELLNEITQSAGCLVALTEGQQAALLQALNVDSMEEANIAIEELPATALSQILVDAVGLTTDAAQSVLGCLGVEIELINLDTFEPNPANSTSPEPNPANSTSTEPTSRDQ